MRIRIIKNHNPFSMQYNIGLGLSKAIIVWFYILIMLKFGFLYYYLLVVLFVFANKSLQHLAITKHTVINAFLAPLFMCFETGWGHKKKGVYLAYILKIGTLPNIEGSDFVKEFPFYIQIDKKAFKEKI